MTTEEVKGEVAEFLKQVKQTEGNSEEIIGEAEECPERKQGECSDPFRMMSSGMASSTAVW
eukprot:CAMPEP_0185778416 /NCGR_PEP_ID=MMETSP1174-20130828/92432_1 /TAXON_ID=35687 /ORGANISM="Dictyocha speculum, Strain CCMP1381" /LENGTH=60 /DNA_ID=CAMNT_0028467121 /DNA_START=150 /DNA_END=329 /DNA_ORIENTATION=-